jgi:uncharacterized membrane protein (DUF4010 family)
MEWFSDIPKDLLNFFLVVLFSLLIGLEQRRRHIREEKEVLFGTDRTFTLIGILGFILYIIQPVNLLFFMGGFLGISLLLGIYYFQKIKIEQRFGITSIVAALITYCLTPLIFSQPHWLVLAIIVIILIVTEIKEDLYSLTQKFDKDEFITLAKFIAIAGVILPLIPKEEFSWFFQFSPYRLWLSVVVVSGLSYFSYLVKKFIFPKSGILLSGILGGLYSSTATTIILARKSKEEPERINEYGIAIVAATGMMYLRILLLSAIFNIALAKILLPYFVLLFLICAGLSFYFLKRQKNLNPTISDNENANLGISINPLEFRVALLFSVLFLAFGLLTEYVLKSFGNAGLNLLSIVTGFTDIDPFLLNLFQGKYSVPLQLLATATLFATTSNNILKLIYALFLSEKGIRKVLLPAFGIIILLGIVMAAFVHFL